MKKYLLAIILTLASLFGANTLKASHFLGLDLYYEHISGNTYRVSVAVYGDCSGAIFSSLATSTPEIDVYNGTTLTPSTLFTTLTLDLQDNGVEVTPVCPSQLANTACNIPNSSLPGVKRYIYSNIVTLNTVSANWHFRFNGTMGGNTSAGRSTNIIKNIDFIASNGSVMVLEAELNNVIAPNSSPKFTTLPTPYYCINVPQQYNQGSVDINNDSLAFALAPALETSAVPAAYVQGYSATNPISTSSGISFNPLNGQFNFTPNTIGGYDIVNRVTEYRNGVKVGSAAREMTFVVLSNCVTNTPPTGTADTTSGAGVGGIMTTSSSFNVCEGTSLLKFNIKPTDLDGDSIEVSVNGLPTGANVIITSNNSPSPKVAFSWNTAAVAPGSYNFFVTYKDQGCPISSQQTQAYTINVIRPNQLTSRIVYPTECAHKAKVEYTLSYGLLPRNIVIRKGASLIKVLTDNSGTVSDSLEAGTYTFTITSPNLTCPTTLNVLVKDSGIYPYPPIFPDTFYCLNDQAVALIATPVAGGNIFWYDSLGRKLSGPPTPSTATAGIFRYMASQFVKVCESRQDTALVYVTKRPTADFIIDPSPVCAQDTATVSFTGAIGVGPILDYKWNWGIIKPISGDSSGPYKVSWYSGGNYTIKLRVFENKCPSDSIEKQIRVKPKPVAAFTLSNSLCQYDSVLAVYATPDSLAGQTYAWDFDGASTPSSTAKGPFKLHWENSSLKTIRLGVFLEGCSDTVSHTADIHSVPEAKIVNVPETVCYGDKIFLQHVATGSNNTYTWLPKGKVDRELDGSPSTRVYVAPTTYSLVVTNEFTCSDTASITYTDVQPCCQFSYPNAFTPNNDTHNDKYKVVTYGNQEYYELSIFNRWGQRIFHSSDPAEGWDGTYNNKPCEMGVYYYMLKAKCLTGYEESKHGELTLLR